MKHEAFSEFIKIAQQRLDGLCRRGKASGGLQPELAEAIKEAGDALAESQAAAAQALRESESLFSLLVENAFDGINVCEFDHVKLKRRLIFCNDRYVQLSGFSRHELEAAEDLNKLITLHASEEGLEYQYDCILKGIPYTGTASWKRPDGKENTYEWTAVSFNKEGKYYIIGIDRDITERKRTEEALEESERKYRTLFEDSLEPMSLTQAGIILDVNRAWLRLHGFTDEREAVGMSVMNVIHPGDRMIMEARRGMSEMDRTRVCPMKDIRKDGSVIDVELYSCAISVGGRLAMLTTVHDISERKRSEEALRESENRYRLLAENVTDVIWTTDFHDRITYLSPSVLRLRGYTAEETMTQPMSQVISAASYQQVDNASEEAQARESAGHRDLSWAWTGEVEVNRKDGSTVWTEVRMTFLRDADQNPVGLVGVARDITERKRADEMLLAYQERLRSLASKLARAQEEERRRVAISLHDHIAQMMAAVQIKLGALRQAAAATGLVVPIDEVRKVLDRAVQDTRSLTVDLSPPILYELGLEPALQWLTEKIQEEHGIQCHFEADARRRPLGQELRALLFAAVRELLHNVVKHAQAHNVWVSVAQHGDNLRIVVRDDGAGFKLSALPPHAVETGGFGLFSMRERLRDLGGQVEVESEPGRGTRVALIMPIKLSE